MGARFLGMAGLDTDRMPDWCQTWTIEDAAVGTFILGLDICRLELKCAIWTEQMVQNFKFREMILRGADEDEIANVIKVDHKGRMSPELEGPHDDDIPNLGDLANVGAKSLRHCAAKCYLDKRCRSFEYSKKKKPLHAGGSSIRINNCQLASL